MLDGVFSDQALANLEQLFQQRVYHLADLGVLLFGDLPKRLKDSGENRGVVGQQNDAVPALEESEDCLLCTSPSPRDRQKSRMPSSA